jgi:hypothetical protein
MAILESIVSPWLAFLFKALMTGRLRRERWKILVNSGGKYLYSPS